MIMKIVIKLTLVVSVLTTLTYCQNLSDEREDCLTQCAIDFWECYWETGHNRKCQTQQNICVLRCPKHIDTGDESVEV